MMWKLEAKYGTFSPSVKIRGAMGDISEWTEQLQIWDATSHIFLPGNRCASWQVERLIVYKAKVKPETYIEYCRAS